MPVVRLAAAPAASDAAGTLGGPMLDVAAIGVHLSLADVAVLVVALLAAGITWTELGGPG